MDRVCRIFLARHAHRDKALGRHENNGLSEKGKLQALALKKYFENLELKNPWFVSSPKLRCVETLEPSSQLHGAEIEISEDLDEIGFNENEQSLFKRFKRFLDRASQCTEVIACSHGDWIPAFTQKTVTQEIDLKKSGVLEIQLIGKMLTLKTVVQSP